MATIGSLNIDLTMKTARLSSDISKAKKKTASFRNSVQRDMRKIKNAAISAGKSIAKIGVIAGAAAIGGLTLMVNKSIEMNDELAKTADKLGVTTKELAGLRHAADLTGVSNQAFSKGLQNMVKTIRDAGDGLATYTRTYDRLGLSVEDLQKLNPAEQFLIVADAISKVENNTQRVGAAYDVFGGRATALINTVNLGTEGLQAMIQEAEDLGIALNRVDASKIEAAKDAITRASAAFEGVGNKITIKLAPFITALGEQVAQIAKDSEGFGTEISNGFTKAANAVAFFADMLRGVEVVFKILNIAAVSFASLALNTFNDLSRGMREFLSLIPGVDFKPIESLQAAADNAQETVAFLNKELSDLVQKPMPSAGIKKFMAEIQAGAQKAAQEVAAASEGRLTAAGAGTDGGGADAARAAMQKKLDNLTTSLLSEEERIIESNIRRQQILADSLDAGLISEAAMLVLSEEQFQQSQDKLLAIRKKGLSDLEKFNAKSWQGQTKDMTGALMAMTAGVADSNKTMFNINKAASIANAVVSTYEGANKALAAYPPPFNFAMAAAVVASGIANVSKIASTSFGSSSATGGSTGGAIPSTQTSTQAIQPAPDGGQAQGNVMDINITFEGRDIGAETLRGMAETIVPEIQELFDAGQQFQVRA